MSLETLREELLKLNREYFSLTAKRKKIVEQIQRQKDQAGTWPCFDPKRELQLFRSLVNELRLLPLEELLSFSLLMESQVRHLGDWIYPAWSQQIHIAEIESDISALVGMINPVLLFVAHPEIFSKISLSSTFSDLLDLSE